MSRGLQRAGRMMLLAMALVLPVCAFAHPPQISPETLAPGARAERPLGAGQSHKYDIQLTEGDFLAASVAPRGIDVALALVGPDGREILNSNTANDGEITEYVLAVADTTGRYELRVTSVNPDAPSGSYVLSIDGVRPATSVDRGRADAMRKLDEGIQLTRRPDRDSREQGLRLLEQARDGFRVAGDRHAESRAAVLVAWQYEVLRSPKALDAGKEAVAFCRGEGDPQWLQAALFAVGSMRVRVGEIDAAEQDLNESLSLAQKSGSVMAEARVHNELGILFGSTGSAERAVEQLKLALDLSRRVHWRELETALLNNLGIATKDLGDYKASLDYYRQTLAVGPELHDPGLQANALNNIGNLYRILHEYQKALDSHQQAVALARQVGSREHEARALNALGWTYLHLGNYRKALDYYEQSLVIRRAINEPAGLASTLDGTGMAWHKLGDEGKALDDMNEALQLRRELGERYGEVESLAHLAEVARDRGKLDQALTNIEAAVELTDSLRGRVMSPDLRASFVAAEDERYDLYVDVLMQLAHERSSDTFAKQALEANERGRARVLLEALLEAHADIRQGIQPALLDEERAQLRKLDEASTRLSRLIVRQAEANALQSARAEVERANADYQQVEARIRTDSPKYAALTQPRALTVDEIQHELLDDDSVLLEFNIGQEQSWLWAVTSSSLTAFELPSRERLESAGRRLYALLTARQPLGGESASARAARIAAADSRWRSASAAFSRMILADAAHALGPRWRGKRLLVAADGVLAYLPFAALPEPLAPGIPLVTRHEIVNVPSASVISAMRHESTPERRSSKQVAILADPVFEADDPRVNAPVRPASAGPASGRRSSRYSRLPFSRQEASAISSLLPADETLRATDFDASRSVVTSGALEDYRIVHFATHGLLNSETPRLSGLVLSLVGRDGRVQDGFLRLNDIYNLRLPADVVVLSACQTALGKEIRGEGLVGLTRGFMYAGAKRVVASLWEVDDLATAELMRWFYRGMLTQHLTPAAALRAAQRKLSLEPEWSAPFYWSGFVIQGEWK